MPRYIYAEEFVRSCAEPKDQPQYGDGRCPFCSNILANRKFKGLHPGYERYFRVALCLDCGWWDLAIDLWTTIPPDEFYYHRAILKHFASEGLAEPAAGLQGAIDAKAPSRLAIPPRQFEVFVGSVFREYLDCEVVLTSYTRDGGIDLYVMDSNQGLFAVEIKRKTGTVGVAIVRQLVGALVENQIEKGIVVTSSSFSRAARDYAEIVSSSSANPYSLDLVDSHVLLSLLNLYALQTDFRWPWIDHLDPWMCEQIERDPSFGS